MASAKGALPILTRAESEIMSALWGMGPDASGTVHDVVEAVPRALAYTTVLTMLRVLEQKGYLAREPSPEGGRAHVYRPTVSEEGARRSHMRDLVDRLFGGHTEELAIGLVRDERLSRADLEQLRAAIDERLAPARPERDERDAKTKRRK